jgi:hypothetical protein
VAQHRPCQLEPRALAHRRIAAPAAAGPDAAEAAPSRAAYPVGRLAGQAPSTALQAAGFNLPPVARRGLKSLLAAQRAVAGT